jgi:enoyl-CoA hydratase
MKPAGAERPIETGTERMIARVEGAVARVIFNNPARHNAVGYDMWLAVPRILAALAGDGAVRCVVLEGAGDKAFVSGADISEFGEKRDSADAVRLYNEAVDAATSALHAFAKPVIAKIRGYCIGGGMAIAIAADLRLAAADARFGIPAARLGLGYAFPGVKRLVDIVGPAFAREIFFTARRFDAAEALAMGLVNRVVDPAALEERVAETARSIAANAPLTVAAAKLCIGEALKDAGGRDLEACAQAVAACFASEDYAEGRAAFAAKRDPVFKGR